MCLHDGYVRLQVKCDRCETEAIIARLTAFASRARQWKSRQRTPRYSSPVRMIRLTEQRQTVPYVWVHPNEER
jgi:hypothetical protein